MTPRALSLIVFAALILTSVWSALPAQSIYRYKDSTGQWQYSDRPPADGRKADVQQRVS